jgi:hypothetical protein
MKCCLRCSAFAAFLLCATVAVAGERKIEISFDAPATNYGVQIEAVYQVGDQLWAVSRVVTRGDFGGQAITTISDAATIETDLPPGTPVIHKILGKTWNWGRNTKTLHFIEDEKALMKELTKKHAVQVWKRGNDTR